MSFKIEKGVPLDTAPYIRWPFERMQVGDSFFTDVRTKRVASAASHYQRKHPAYRFAVRQVRENGKHGARVWRVPK